MNKKSLVIVIIVIVVVILAACLAFFIPQIATALGLRHSAPVQDSTATSTSNRFGMRGGFVTGSIEVLNDDGFTLTLADGTTKDVNLSATTTIEDYTSASSTPTTITSDSLSVGEQVSVIGTPSDDGSIDARTVRTGAVPMRGPGMRNGSGTPSVPAQ